MKIRAAVLDRMGAEPPYAKSKPLRIVELELDPPGRGEILVRVAAAGLCHSDLSVINGDRPRPMPMALGHESAGVVEQVGSEVRYVQKGDHVITCLSVFCGECDNCTSGRPVICTDTNVKMLPGQAERLSRNGSRVHTFANLSGYAEMMLVHEHAVVKVDKERVDYWLKKGAQPSDSVRTLIARHLTVPPAAPAVAANPQ